MIQNTHAPTWRSWEAHFWVDRYQQMAGSLAVPSFPLEALLPQPSSSWLFAITIARTIDKQVRLSIIERLVLRGQPPPNSRRPSGTEVSIL